MGAPELPALEGHANGCNLCPPILPVLSMDRDIAVGFGDAHVSRDGEIIYREDTSGGSSETCADCDGSGVRQGAGYQLVACKPCGGFGYTGELPELWIVLQAEQRAAADPDHDWRIVLFGPLHGEVYQRQGVGTWVLVESNQGFA